MSINRRKRAMRANRGTGWSINWTRERSYVVGGPAGVLSIVPAVCRAGLCDHVSHPPSHDWKVLAMVPAGTDVFGAYESVMRVWRLA
jgi:hypothetical protein